MLINIMSWCYGNNVVTGYMGINYLVVDIYKGVTKGKGYTWHGVTYKKCDTYLYDSLEG